MISKNQILEVTIEDMGSEGEGVAKVDGYALFVKDAVKGDVLKVKVVKAQKNYGYARIEEVIIPSPIRVAPVCSVARSCGGCQIQEMSYEAQLEYKQNKVRNNLERIGKLEGVEVLPTIGMETPYNYRNKAQFPVGMDKEGNIVMGFYAGRTHSIITCDDCAIGHPVNNRILDIVKKYMKENKITPYDETTGKGVVRHVLVRVGFKTGEIMVCLIVNADKLPGTDELVGQLRKIEGMTSVSYNINKEQTNRILGEKIVNLYGEGYISDYIGDVRFKISPLSFYQVNPVQTEKLYGKALEFAGLTGEETVWDLYCGVGTISLFLAKNAKKVYGVEIVPAAIENARENAKLNGITNSEFFVGKSEEVLPEFYKKIGERADVIVVDPPRVGIQPKALDKILEYGVKQIVYVSCNPKTLADNIRYMDYYGYKCKYLKPFDNFPFTKHIEAICLLSRD